MKKVSFGVKPVSANKPLNPDDFVKQVREGGVERMKRLTVDVPLTLHTRIKSQCALQSVQMADVIRDMLEQRFPG
jgi:hypothetical protein